MDSCFVCVSTRPCGWENSCSWVCSSSLELAMLFIPSCTFPVRVATRGMLLFLSFSSPSTCCAWISGSSCVVPVSFRTKHWRGVTRAPLTFGREPSSQSLCVADVLAGCLRAPAFKNLFWFLPRARPVHPELFVRSFPSASRRDSPRGFSERSQSAVATACWLGAWWSVGTLDIVNVH